MSLSYHACVVRHRLARTTFSTILSMTAEVPDSAQAPVNPWIVTIAVMLGTFMEILDTTVVNVSIPHIAGNMGATVEEGTWVVTSYLVSNAVILPMSGWLANRFGRRRILVTCVAGFTLTSLLC